jgi:hypothetical protein
MQVLILEIISFSLTFLLFIHNSSAEVFKIDEGKTAYYCRIQGNKVTAGLLRRNKFIPSSKILEKVPPHKLPAKKKLWKERRAKCRETYTRMRYRPLDIEKSATGLEPIDVRLSTERDRCELLDRPNTLIIEEFSGGCDLLVRPVDHRVKEVTLGFVTIDSGVRSLPANLKLTWDQESAFIGDKHSLAPYKSKLSKEELGYLARWINLGAYLPQLSEANEAGGLEAVLDFLLANRSCPEIAAQAESVASHNFTNIFIRDKDFPRRDGQGTVTIRLFSDVKLWWTSDAVATYWMHLMRNTCQPLKERVAIMWFNHFAVDLSRFDWAASGRSRYGKAHLDLLRGRTSLFAPILELVNNMHGSNGAMLVWLDNFNVWNSATNENYARELMELFLLGERHPITKQKNYTQNDVWEMSYALTGYHDPNRPLSPRSINQCCTRSSDINSPDYHCPEPNQPDNRTYCETVTNFQEPFRQPEFLDSRWNDVSRPQRRMLFENTPHSRYQVWKAAPTEDSLTPYILNEVPGTKDYLATRMIGEFASQDPTLEMVESVGEKLKSDNFEITNSLRKILSSSAQFKRERECLAEPNISTMSFIRMLNLPLGRFTNSTSDTTINLFDVLRWGLPQAGAYMTRPPSVFGWRSCGKVDQQGIHRGLTFGATQYLLERDKTFVSYLNYLHRLQNGSFPAVTFRWVHLLPAGQLTPDRILNHFEGLLGIKLLPAEREILIGYLGRVALRHNMVDGVPYVDQSSLRNFNYSTLDSLGQADRTAFLNQKITGLLRILFSMKINNTI